MPHEEHPRIPAMQGPSARLPRRLILCFDGTGNEFSGNTSDTNIVKLYQKFDRCSPHQMHYYQPGIGTYSTDGASINLGWFGRMKRSISQTLDQGFASTFDSHVISGYRFLMRYYNPGDRIYIFGFSRGAFTARFVARMVAQIGLLSVGNDEMVPFAYKTYQDYEIALNLEKGTARTLETLRDAEEKAAKSGMAPPVLTDLENKMVYIENFKETFCRHDHYDATVGQGSRAEDHLPQILTDVEQKEVFIQTPEHHNSHYSLRNSSKSSSKHSEVEYMSASRLAAERGATYGDEHDHDHSINPANKSAVKVHFLGLFDTVNSVGTLDVPWGATMQPPRSAQTAEHIRHAVSVDERRVKFRPALLQQEREDDRASLNATVEASEDIKEVWFPGNHGDVGGGWPAPPRKGEETEKAASWWARVKDFFQTKHNNRPTANESQDNFQLSDIALKWMIDELDGLPNDRVQWNGHKQRFLDHFAERRDAALRATAHDTMRFFGGASWVKVIFWNFLDRLPFIKRWELDSGKWEYVALPLNAGGSRDIPRNAVFHSSVLERMRLLANAYRPGNLTYCGTRAGEVKAVRLWEGVAEGARGVNGVNGVHGVNGVSGVQRVGVRDGVALGLLRPRFVLKERGRGKGDATYVLDGEDAT